MRSRTLASACPVALVALLWPTACIQGQSTKDPATPEPEVLSTIYYLDAAKNGLCLNKQCHWAFDEGLFRLTFDEAEHIYVISIPSPVRLAAANAHFDIASFDAIVGPIPRERLPTNENLWPSSQYLQELNDFLDDEAA